MRALWAPADGFLTRGRGLLGRSELSSRQGMLIRPTWSVHTAFMRFAIDVVFLDEDLTVLKIAQRLRPWRTAFRRGAHPRHSSFTPGRVSGSGSGSEIGSPGARSSPKRDRHPQLDTSGRSAPASPSSSLEPCSHGTGLAQPA